jgi:hypothetical protein
LAAKPSERFSDPGQHIVEAEHLQQAQDLDELPFAGFAQAGLEQPAQARELFGQGPAGHRRALVSTVALRAEAGQGTPPWLLIRTPFGAAPSTSRC